MSLDIQQLENYIVEKDKIINIPFNKPHLTGKEAHYMYQAVYDGKLSGNGQYTKRCQRFFEEKYGFKTLRFSNEEVLCNTDDTIARIKFALDYRRKYLAFTEGYDVANGCHSGGNQRKGLPLGGIGHLAAFSFHETKNVTSGGEGGLMVINDERFIRRAEIIWEKGTNRAEFFRGEVNKYGWVDIGSSFLPSEINAAFLWAQLENLDDIQNKRKLIWNRYFELLSPLASTVTFSMPDLPDYATNNAHMFYLIFNNIEQRSSFIKYLKEHDVLSVFHYLSLHKSAYYMDKHDGRELAECDRYADTLVRLPMFYDLELSQVDMICELIKEWSRSYK